VIKTSLLATFEKGAISFRGEIFLPPREITFVD